MKSERYKQRIKLVYLAFVMMVCVAIPNQVYAAGKNKEAALTVEQTVKGKTNEVTDEFQYELTSLDSGNPMPEGSNGDRLKFSLMVMIVRNWFFLMRRQLLIDIS